MEHWLILAALWGGGTLIVLFLIRFIFTLIPNPFDELDEEEIKEMESAGESLTNVGGKINGF